MSNPRAARRRPGPKGASRHSAAIVPPARAIPVFLLVLLGGALARPVSAQGIAEGGEPAVPTGLDAAPYRVERISGPVELDGRMDELFWQSIEPLSAVGHTPDFGATPSEPTEFRLAHDGTNFYFSCRAFDSEPRLVQGASYRRDESAFGSDRCSIYLDTLDDEENSLGFSTTPAGIRLDLAFSNDAQGPPNLDWNAFWDVAVTRDDEGWHAEFRIPFSSLILQESGGEVQMGFSMLRSIARRNEMTTHPAMSPAYGFASFVKPSRMRTLLFEEVEVVRPIYFTPYVLGGTGYSHAFSSAESVYDRTSSRTAEAGFDLRTGLTSNLTLDLTVNTDFAQVEVDDQQVNLTRFPLFFPEKRRFFQERAVTFEYSLGGQERLFHSRRIGLVEGEAVRIYGGARLVGRVGQWDVGVLNMQTAESETLPADRQVPSENLGVVRLRRRVFNDNSYLGGIVTSRTGSDGQYNVVYGLDGIIRVVGNEYLTLNWAQSYDDGIPGTDDNHAQDNSIFRSSWQRRQQDFLSYTLAFTNTGSIFEPGMGFLRRRDYAAASASIGYGWRFADPASRVLRTALSASGGGVRRNDDHVVESVDASLQGSVELRTGHQWSAAAVFSREDLPEPLRNLPEGAMVPVGRYSFLSGRLQYQAPQSALFRPMVTIEAGEFYDGRQMSLSFSPTWSASPNLTLGGTYQLDHVTFEDREQEFTSHVTRLRAEVMFSTRLSVISFVQYNSSQNAVIANFRLRYNPREGNDFYVVWNEGLVTESGEFERPTSDSRTILVKYSHTLQLGL